MKKSEQSNAALYWVIGVIVFAMVIFVYLVVADSPKTLSKIKLSYFKDEQEVADSVTKRLFQEIRNNNNTYWIGLEPDKPEQIDILNKIKNNLEKNVNFQKVIIDEELSLRPEDYKKLNATETIALKDNLMSLGEKLAEYQKQNVSYILITASIYSTSLLKKNPIHILKEKLMISPMTFSIGYFSVDADDENKSLFKCDTEDHSGTKDWGCFVINKARSVRRKIDFKNVKSWKGLMDLSGEKDYIILLKKN